MADSRRIDDLTERVATAELRQASTLETLKMIQKGETKLARVNLGFFSSLTIAISLLSLAGAFFLRWNQNDNTDRINTAVKEAHDTINEITRTNSVERVEINSSLGEQNVVVAQVAVGFGNMHGIDIYYPTITFSVEVNAIGEGVGRLLGFRLKYRGDFVSLISKRSGKIDRYREQIYLNGSSTYFDQSRPITAAGGNIVKWDLLGDETTSCDQAERAAIRLSAITDGAFVDFKPIMERVTLKPDFSSLKIKMTEYIPILGCQDLTRKRMNSNISSARSP